MTGAGVEREAERTTEHQAKREAKAAEREASIAERQASEAARAAERQAKREARAAETERKAAERQEKADLKAERDMKKREDAQAAYRARLPKRLQFSAGSLGIKVKDGFVYKGLFGSLSWPAMGSHAELYAEDSRGKRVTLTRVALTGIFALGLKKKTGKLQVHVTISGDGWSVSGRTENVELAHTFVNEWNSLYGSEGTQSGDS